jgi:hypothetical protein
MFGETVDLGVCVFGYGDCRPVSVIQKHGEVEKSGIGTLQISRPKKRSGAFWGRLELP